MKRSATFAGALAVSASLLAAPVAGASAPHGAMAATKTGTFVKLDSMDSFSMKVGTASYVVTTNAMTHVTENHMKIKLTKLKRGDTVTVKGHLEMHGILATSVSVTM